MSTTAPEVPDETGYEWRFYAYAGRRAGADVKTVHSYVDLSGDGRNLNVAKRLVPLGGVGSLVKAWASETRVRTSGVNAPELVSQDDLPDDVRPPTADEAAQWSAADEAHGTLLAKEARERRILREEVRDPIQEHVAALRHAMAGLNRTQRHAVVASILDGLLS